jgi:hypothetical protein
MQIKKLKIKIFRKTRLQYYRSCVSTTTITTTATTSTTATNTTTITTETANITTNTNTTIIILLLLLLILQKNYIIVPVPYKGLKPIIIEFGIKEIKISKLILIEMKIFSEFLPKRSKFLVKYGNSYLSYILIR